MEPLTAEKQRFAEEHIEVVRRFLRSRRLDYDEYWDVVIFGYLDAVSYYVDRISEIEAPFGAIAFKFMKHDYYNYLNYKKAAMRGDTAASLDTGFSGEENEDDDFDGYDLVPAKVNTNPEWMFDYRNMMEQAFAAASPTEARIVRLVLQGYNQEEISAILQIAKNTVNSYSSKFYAKARCIRDGVEYISPQKKYTESHREEVLERNRQRRREHRVEQAAARRERYLSNIEEERRKAREYQRRRRAAMSEEELEAERSRCRERQARKNAEKKAKEAKEAKEEEANG